MHTIKHLVHIFVTVKIKKQIVLLSHSLCAWWKEELLFGFFFIHTFVADIPERWKISLCMLSTASMCVVCLFRNTMSDFGSEVMAEALAQRALVKPVYTIPIIPLSNSNQYRHQDHMDMKDYKKVRTQLMISPHSSVFSSPRDDDDDNVWESELKFYRTI